MHVRVALEDEMMGIIDKHTKITQNPNSWHDNKLPIRDVDNELPSWKYLILFIDIKSIEDLSTEKKLWEKKNIKMIENLRIRKKEIKKIKSSEKRKRRFSDGRDIKCKDFHAIELYYISNLCHQLCEDEFKEEKKRIG